MVKSLGSASLIIGLLGLSSCSGMIYDIPGRRGVAIVASASSSNAIYNTGELRWTTHLGQDTRDNVNFLDPYTQVDAVNGSDVCMGVSHDSSGNIYCAGYTASALNGTGGGSNDAFVMKLNSSGVVQWITHLGTATRDNSNGLDPNSQVDSIDGNDICNGVSVDTSGNVYCAGYTISNLNDVSGGGNDAFVMKLNSSGVVQWITQLGTSTRDNSNGLNPNSQVDAVNGTENCTGVSVDTNGNVYCAGNTNGALNDTGGGGADAFVMKLSSAGVVQWVTHLGTDTRDNMNGLDPNSQIDAVNLVDTCNGVSVDTNGNVYCAGYTTSALNDSAGGGNDAFVMKLNSSGVVQWLTHLGTSTRDNSNGLDPNSQVDAVNGADLCNSVSVDVSGNTYCAGYTASALNDTVGGGTDAFVMKLSSSGAVQWLTQLGTATRDNSNGLDPNSQIDSITASDSCSSVSVDISGNVYCAGYTYSSLNDTAGGNADAMVMKLNSSGVVQWLTHFGTNTRDNSNGLNPNSQVDAVDAEDVCNGVSVDTSGNVYCAGVTSSALNDTAGGSQDVFVMHLQ